MKIVHIPENVGKWIEFCKNNNLEFLESMDTFCSCYFGKSLITKDYQINVSGFSGSVTEILKWIRTNQESYANAWVNGYECYPEVFQVYLRSNDAGSKLLLHKILLEDGRIGYEWSCFNTDDKNHFTKSELIGLGLEWLFSCPDVELIRIYN